MSDPKDFLSSVKEAAEQLDITDDDWAYLTGIADQWQASGNTMERKAGLWIHTLVPTYRDALANAPSAFDAWDDMEGVVIAFSLICHEAVSGFTSPAVRQEARRRLAETFAGNITQLGADFERAAADWPTPAEPPDDV